MTTQEVYMLRDAAIAKHSSTSNVDQKNRLAGFILACEIILGIPARIATEQIARATVEEVASSTIQTWAQKVAR